MDSRFLPHNLHQIDPQRFAELDPQLRQLQQQTFVHRPYLLEQLLNTGPGIYTLGGGRQIGKSTLLKQWMAALLARKVAPAAIAFISGELIDDHHQLLNIMQTTLATMPVASQRYLLIDEITYIKSWDKAIKYAADAGMLENCVLLLTGSDLTLMQEARVTFPGRRGNAAANNFHLYPLSFYETVKLKNPQLDLANALVPHAEISKELMDTLFAELNAYLVHGGYLTAMNDLAATGMINAATLMTYSDWIRGDMLKRGKQEHYLREILGAIVKRYNSQVTWNNLAADLSIDHPKTVADYVALLESMDAVFNQSALLEDKLVAAPKKARKLMFTDPFIFHAIRAWLVPVRDPYQQQILPLLADPQLAANLVEACSATHYSRFFPTYYIKAEGEVDIAYIDQQRFWPVEIKWTHQLRAKDLKQIQKYPNGKILAKMNTAGNIGGIPAEPLPLALLRLQTPSGVVL